MQQPVLAEATCQWHFRDQSYDLRNRCLVMGIVNVTPDSFSDGGRFLTSQKAVDHALHLIDAGADLIDIGGESSRPGSTPVPASEELRRIIPVIERLAQQTSIPISIDTCKAEVASKAFQSGASILNDITALASYEDNAQIHEAMVEVCREHQPGLILMHMQGAPKTMQAQPHYEDAVEDIFHFFQNRVNVLVAMGLPRESMVIDPGIGFGKKDKHNFALLQNLKRFQDLGRPVCLGVSRKGFLGRLLDREVGERDGGSLAVACHALGQGAAQIIRAHDTAMTRDAILVYRALSHGKKGMEE